jgi:phosphomannomutase
MDQIHNHVLNRHDEGNVNAIDGVRVRSADGWWLIRASNTEAALVARAEAGSAIGLEQLIDEIQTTLNAAGL